MFSNYKKTLLSLLSHPRNVVDGFIHGNGTSFMHPFRFLLAGIAVLLLLNTLLVDFTINPQPNELGLDGENDQMAEIAEWIQVSNVRASTQFLPLSLALIFIPMLALGGLIFLRDKTDGFYNNLVLNSFAVGAALVALPLLIPAWIFLGYPLTDPFVNSTLPAVLVAGVIMWIYNLYLHPSGLMDWIRLISAYTTGYIFYVILHGFVTGVIGYMGFAINRIRELLGA